MQRYSAIDDCLTNKLNAALALLVTGTLLLFKKNNGVCLRIRSEKDLWGVQCLLWTHHWPVAAEVVLIEKGDPLGPTGGLQKRVQWVVGLVRQDKLAVVEGWSMRGGVFAPIIQ